MPANPYINPIFYVDNQLQLALEQGSVDSSGTGGLAGYPLSRVYDDLIELEYRPDDSTQWYAVSWNFKTGAAELFPAAPVYLIVENTQLQGEYSNTIFGAWSGATSPDQSIGSADFGRWSSRNGVLAPGVLPWRTEPRMCMELPRFLLDSGGDSLVGFQGSQPWQRMEQAIGLGSSPQQGIGEIYSGPGWTTNAGIEPDWLVGTEPNVAQSESFAGRVYSLVRGEQRRTYSFSYAGIDGRDAAVLREVERRVGIREKPFYFMPPDFGNIGEIVDGTDFADGNWVLDPTFDTGNTILSYPGAVGPYEENVLQINTSNGNRWGIELPTPAGTYNFTNGLDVNEAINQNHVIGTYPLLSFDICQTAGNAGDFTGSQGVRLRIVNSDFIFIIHSEFRASNALAGDFGTTPEQWYRCTIDLQNTAEFIGIGGNGAANVINSILLYMDTNVGAAQEIQLCNLRWWERGRIGPIRAELMGFNAQQTSRVPGGPAGLRYDVQMEVREVLS